MATLPARLPIFWTFRRCPYAMRARVAVQGAGIDVEWREIMLRDKPREMLEASPKGTIPVLVLENGTVLEESLDIIHWALGQQDPNGWLPQTADEQHQTHHLIAQNDGPFKRLLDRYKYAPKGDENGLKARDEALSFLGDLEQRLKPHGQLLRPTPSLADYALFPFVRQFAHVDVIWFQQQDLPCLQTWLENHLNSSLFSKIMEKRPLWSGPPIHEK